MIARSASCAPRGGAIAREHVCAVFARGDSGAREILASFLRREIVRGSEIVRGIRIVLRAL